MNELVSVENKRQELADLIDGSELEKTKAQLLLDNFTAYFDIAAEWELHARAIVVKDESETALMKMAREGRLFLRQKRIDVEKARKQLKEQALREGKAIDGIANVLKALIVPIEEHLDAQEHFAERKAAAAAEAIRIEEERAAKEREEQERLAAIAEEKRIREENERLRVEAQEREAAAREEREAHEREMAAAREKERKEAAEREREQMRAREELKRVEEAAERKIEAEREAAQEREAAAQEKMRNQLSEQRRAADEDRRIASLVKCPKCGHEFKAQEALAHGGTVTRNG